MFSAQPVITETGRALLLRAAGGEQITFTKFQAGSGSLSPGEDPHTVTALKQVELSDIPITKAESTEDDGYIQLDASFDNQTDVEEDFLWTELGLIAEDEDGVEYLYAYGYDGEYAELIKAGGSAVVLEQSISAIIAIGESENITVNILPTASYASRSEFLAHTADENNPHSVTYTQVGAAAASHTHSAADVTSGVLAVARGGTGVNSLAALANLVLGEQSYVLGFYDGNGAFRQDITLGFSPSRVYVAAPLSGAISASNFSAGSFMFAPNMNLYDQSLPMTCARESADDLLDRKYGGAAVTDTGFAVGAAQGHILLPNIQNTHYVFVAFK